MFKLKRIALVKLPDRVHPDCEENKQITEMGINKKSLRLGGEKTVTQSKFGE